MAVGIDNKVLINAVRELKALGIIKYDSEIAETLGYTRAVVSEYLNNKKAVSEIFLTKLFEAYPEAKKAGTTKKGKGAPEIQDLGDKMLIHVPLVHEYAYAGYIKGWGDAQYIGTLPTAPFIVDKEPRGTYIAFVVSGDSMDDGSVDSILEKDIVLCREIKRELWQSKLHIKKWDFVVHHREYGLSVKRITNHNTVKGTITCHSLNEDYKDYTAKLDDVVRLFNVVQVVRKK